MWDFLQPSGERRAPPLWWTSPPPPSARDGAAHTAPAVKPKATSASGTAAVSVSKGIQGRAKPAKASVAAAAPPVAEKQPSQASVSKLSCATATRGAVISVEDLDGWLAGPLPGAAEEPAASHESVQRPKRKAKTAEVRRVQARGIRSCTVNLPLTRARCCSLSGLLAGLMGTLLCSCNIHITI